MRRGYWRCVPRTLTTDAVALWSAWRNLSSISAIWQRGAVGRVRGWEGGGRGERHWGTGAGAATRALRRASNPGAWTQAATPRALAVA